MMAPKISPFLSDSDAGLLMKLMVKRVAMLRIESEPERPSIPSVAFVALIDTTKSITASVAKIYTNSILNEFTKQLPKNIECFIEI